MQSRSERRLTQREAVKDDVRPMACRSRKMAAQIESRHEAAGALCASTCVVLEQELAAFVQHSGESGCGADEGWSLHVFVRSHAIDKVGHVADWAKSLRVERLIVLS